MFLFSGGHSLEDTKGGFLSRSSDFLSMLELGYSDPKIYNERGSVNLIRILRNLLTQLFKNYTKTSNIRNPKKYKQD